MSHAARRGLQLGALAALVPVLLGASPASAVSGRHDDPTARVWVTTPDRQLQLAQQDPVRFTKHVPQDLTITVDASRSYQSVAGFGASITDSAAAVLYRLDPQARRDVMAQLFSPTAGIGLSYLRQPMGASDFVDEPHYTYNDLAPGQTDFAMTRFSIAHDQTQILPLLREARRLNPHLKIMATPWSPPAWMKTGGSLAGGRFIDDDRYYRAYALYFVKFLQAYERAGVPVDAVTVQNEPQNRHPDYPGMDLPVAQERKLIQALGPALRRAGLRTKILAFDHNWAMHPGDIGSTPPGETPETDYPYDALSDPDTARWIAGTAYHCYFGEPAAQTRLHKQFPGKDVYFTECSGSRGPDDSDAKAFNDTLRWHARNLIIGTTRNWARTVINWNLALDRTGGPHVGGCNGCTAPITVNDDGTVTRNAEYFTLGHLARFVAPGATRIASTSYGSTGWNGNMMSVAFRNRDGSTVLVVHNQHDDPRTFAVSSNGYAFSYTLPGGALATFTWPRSSKLDGSRELLDITGVTATASPPAPENPCCSGDVAANVTDDDGATRWSTGTGQQPGQWVQLDLGRRRHATALVLDAGPGLGDYPRAYQVTVSDNGTDWTPAGSGTGTGQHTNINLPPRPMRFIRVTLTAPAEGSWWSVAEARLYR